MLNPKLLVLDEPTSNLDYKAIQELHDMIVKKKAEGVTIVIAEHRLAWLADIADRFCYFADGELTSEWNAEDFKKLLVGQLQEMGLRPLEIKSYRTVTMEKRQNKMLDATPFMKAEQLSIGYGKHSPVYRIGDLLEQCNIVRALHRMPKWEKLPE